MISEVCGMRYCVPIPCFFGKEDFSESVKKVAHLGFDAVETYNWKQLDFDKVNGTCKEYGVELISMCTTEFNLTEPSMRKCWLDGLKESCLAAKRLNVKKIITQVGNDTGSRLEYQHKSIVDGLKAAKPILEDCGVTLMIEPLNTKVNHPGYYLTSSSEAFDIIREVESDFVRVVFDIYHQQISEGNIIPNIKDNIECIAHIHAAGHPGRHELQYGENNYHVIFSAIEKAGYVGAVGLEYNPLLPAEESLLEFKRIYINQR